MVFGDITALENGLFWVHFSAFVKLLGVREGTIELTSLPQPLCTSVHRTTCSSKRRCGFRTNVRDVQQRMHEPFRSSTYDYIVSHKARADKSNDDTQSPDAFVRNDDRGYPSITEGRRSRHTKRALLRLVTHWIPEAVRDESRT